LIRKPQKPYPRRILTDTVTPAWYGCKFLCGRCSSSLCGRICSRLFSQTGCGLSIPCSPCSAASGKNCSYQEYCIKSPSHLYSRDFCLVSIVSLISSWQAFTASSTVTPGSFSFLMITGGDQASESGLVFL